MSLENNNQFYRKRDNTYRNSETTNNNYKKNNSILHQTKTDVFPFNSKYKPNQKFYKKTEPQNAAKYNNKTNKIINPYRNRKDFMHTTNNSNNNNSINDNSFKKNPFYIRNLKDKKSPIKYNNNFIMYESNTLDNRSHKKNNKFNINYNDNKELKTVSPIKKYIEKKDFNFYINDGNKKRNDIILQKHSNINNSLDNIKIDKNNITNSNNNNNFLENVNYTIKSSRSHQKRGRDIDIDIPTLNIYQKKMITIFVQIINKIIIKNKKYQIMKNFFIILRNNFYIHNRGIDNSDHKYIKKDSKYNEYKEIIYNYVKTTSNLPMKETYDISKKEKELINKINKKKEPIYQRNKKNNELKSKNSDNKKNNMKRLKELEKKYEKIYERKKNSNTSIDRNYKNYYLRKFKTQNTFDPKKINNSSYSFIKYLNNSNYKPNGENTFNKKILKFNLFRNIDNLSMNLSQEEIPKHNYINLKQYSTLSNIGRHNEYQLYKNETPKKNTDNNNNKIIVKKLKITPKISKDIKDKNYYDTYNIINIKDITTLDGRLHVYINYITLYNKQEKKQYYYYDSNLLKISNKIIINYLNKKIEKKPKKINYFKNNSKKLTKIEEVPEDKYTNSSVKRKKSGIDNNNNIKEAILILENYKNNLKKKTIKKNINNENNIDNDLNNNNIKIGILKFKNKEENKRYFKGNYENKNKENKMKK